MLPPAYRHWATSQQVGLPPEHPWIDELPAWDTTDAHPDWPAGVQLG